jgi:predicted O-methyltransferase YrrM
MNKTYNDLFPNLSSPSCTGELGIASIEKLMQYATISDPTTVVEIGFNRGSSALGFLLVNNHCKVYSIDIRPYSEVQGSVEYLQTEFPNRFTYISSDSAHMLTILPVTSADLVFIDGDHSAEAVSRDLLLALQLSPKCIILDDACHHAHKSDIRGIISSLGLDSKTVIDCDTSIHGSEASSGFAIINLT